MLKNGSYMSNSFVLVVMDNHKAKIWSHGLEVDSPAIEVEAVEAPKEHDARAGEPKGGEALPTFLEDISKHLKDANAILLIGPGKGKASGPLHLRDYLNKKHPVLGNRIYEIEGIDLTHTSEKEILAHARTQWTKYRQSH